MVADIGGRRFAVDKERVVRQPANVRLTDAGGESARRPIRDRRIGGRDDDALEAALADVIAGHCRCRRNQSIAFGQASRAASSR